GRFCFLSVVSATGYQAVVLIPDILAELRKSDLFVQKPCRLPASAPSGFRSFRVRSERPIREEETLR
ncbi:MAG: hypothetical protein QOI36_4367, partial [Pseudonocardiales bacterium]|nr:hypothetical protein [Pseudonocardiales bacterium]